MVRGPLAFRGVAYKPEACGRESLCVRRDARPTQMPLKIGNLKDLGITRAWEQSLQKNKRCRPCDFLPGRGETKRGGDERGDFLITNRTNFHEWGAASLEMFVFGLIRVDSKNLTESLPLIRPSARPSVAPPHARPDIRLWFKWAALGQIGGPRRTSAFPGR